MDEGGEIMRHEAFLDCFDDGGFKEGAELGKWGVVVEFSSVGKG